MTYLVVLPEHKGLWRLAEVKSSRSANPRTQRQMAKIQQLQDYLDSGRTKDLYQRPEFASYDMMRINAPRSEVTHAARMMNLISLAYTTDFAWEQVENGLLYLAMTPRGIPKMDQLSDKLGPRVLAFHVDPYWRLPGYQPLVLSITDPEALYDFYCGQMSLVVACDLDVVGSKFTALGWDWYYQPNEPFAFRLQERTPQDPSQPATISVASTMFCRVAVEFTSLDWMLDTVAQHPEAYFGVHTDSPS